MAEKRRFKKRKIGSKVQPHPGKSRLSGKDGMSHPGYRGQPYVGRSMRMGGGAYSNSGIAPAINAATPAAVATGVGQIEKYIDFLNKSSSKRDSELHTGLANAMKSFGEQSKANTKLITDLMTDINRGNAFSKMEVDQPNIKDIERRAVEDYKTHLKGVEDLKSQGVKEYMQRTKDIEKEAKKIVDTRTGDLKARERELNMREQNIKVAEAALDKTQKSHQMFREMIHHTKKIAELRGDLDSISKSISEPLMEKIDSVGDSIKASLSDLETHQRKSVTTPNVDLTGHLVSIKESVDATRTLSTLNLYASGINAKTSNDIASLIRVEGRKLAGDVAVIKDATTIAAGDFANKVENAFDKLNRAVVKTEIKGDQHYRGVEYMAHNQDATLQRIIKNQTMDRMQIGRIYNIMNARYGDPFNAVYPDTTKRARTEIPELHTGVARDDDEGEVFMDELYHRPPHVQP